MATQTIYTVKDCKVWKEHPSTNYWDWALDVDWDETGGNLATEHSFIAFDITSTPVNSLITSVRLYVHYDDSSESGSLYARFMRVTEAWTHTGITWNNQPSVTSTNQFDNTFSSTGYGWYNFDITDMYKAAKTAGNELGVRIHSRFEADGWWRFTESEATPSYTAYIVITYLATGDYYVKTGGNDALTGDSWANAWATVNKAATTVPDGSTVHIEHGTYNAEPAGNKIAPQNAGASGIAYKPEIVGGGAGSCWFTVEKN